MPAKSTIFLWLRKNREFSIQYRCAKQVQIDRMLCQFGEPLMEIADNSTNDIRSAKRRIAAGKLHIGRAHAQEVLGLVRRVGQSLAGAIAASASRGTANRLHLPVRRVLS